MYTVLKIDTQQKEQMKFYNTIRSDDIVLSMIAYVIGRGLER